MCGINNCIDSIRVQYVSHTVIAANAKLKTKLYVVSHPLLSLPLLLLCETYVRNNWQLWNLNDYKEWSPPPKSKENNLSVPRELEDGRWKIESMADGKPLTLPD